jgi:hypothetical protein
MKFNGVFVQICSLKVKPSFEKKIKCSIFVNRIQSLIFHKLISTSTFYQTD